MSKKKRLFSDSSLKRILSNLFQDNQLSFDFLRWILLRTWLQILINSPAEFLSVATQLFKETPIGVVLEALEKSGVLKALPKAAEEEDL